MRIFTRSLTCSSCAHLTSSNRHGLYENPRLNLQTDECEAYANIDWARLQAGYRLHGIEVRRVPVRDFDPEDLTIKLSRMRPYASRASRCRTHGLPPLHCRDGTLTDRCDCITRRFSRSDNVRGPQQVFRAENNRAREQVDRCRDVTASFSHRS